MDPLSDGDPADKVNHSHTLEVVDGLEPRGVQDSERSVEVGSSGDAPCEREVRAGEEGPPVVRDVIEDAVDDLLGKAHTACFARTEDPLHLPSEAFAAKPQRVKRLLCIYSRRGNQYVNNSQANIHEIVAHQSGLYGIS